MLKNRDWIELLSLFNACSVRYLVIGGYAVMRYAEPRATKDLDLWIARDKSNAEAVFAALRTFGAPLHGLSSDDFLEEGWFYRMGRPPLRVDVMITIPGMGFEEAWPHREVVEIAETPIPFIAKQDLIRVKTASARPQDMIDIDMLAQSDS